MEDKERIDFFDKSLDTVNYWLQFAEAKNAALIAFIMAMMAVIYTCDIKINSYMLIVLSVGYIVSLGISLYSFLPVTLTEPGAPQGEYSDSDNLLFWGCIYKYATEDYLKKIYVDYFLDFDTQEFSKLVISYAKEIIINARITNRKYLLFKKSLFISIIVTILLPVFLIIIA